MFDGALAGDPRARTKALALMEAAQKRARAEAEKNLQAFERYKDEYEVIFQQYDAAGRTRPEPVPHPYELDFDERAGEIICNGPRSARQKRRWDEKVKTREELLEEIEELKALKADRPELSEVLDREIEHNTKLAEMIHAMHPAADTRRTPGFNLKRWRKEHDAYGRSNRLREWADGRSAEWD